MFPGSNLFFEHLTDGFISLVCVLILIALGLVVWFLQVSETSRKLSIHYVMAVFILPINFNESSRPIQAIARAKSKQ